MTRRALCKLRMLTTQLNFIATSPQNTTTSSTFRSLPQTIVSSTAPSHPLEKACATYVPAFEHILLSLNPVITKHFDTGINPMSFRSSWCRSARVWIAKLSRSLTASLSRWYCRCMWYRHRRGSQSCSLTSNSNWGSHPKRRVATHPILSTPSCPWINAAKIVRLLVYAASTEGQSRSKCFNIGSRQFCFQWSRPSDCSFPP